MAAISAGAVAALAAGAALGIGVERSGQRTPAGGVLRGAGVDVSGGAFAPGLPELQAPIEQIKPMPTINDEAVKKARNSRLLNLQKQSGAASTILTGDRFGG